MTQDPIHGCYASPISSDELQDKADELFLVAAGLAGENSSFEGGVLAQAALSMALQAAMRAGFGPAAALGLGPQGFFFAIGSAIAVQIHDMDAEMREAAIGLLMTGLKGGLAMKEAEAGTPVGATRQ